MNISYGPQCTIDVEAKQKTPKEKYGCDMTKKLKIKHDKKKKTLVQNGSQKGHKRNVELTACTAGHKYFMTMTLTAAC